MARNNLSVCSLESFYPNFFCNFTIVLNRMVILPKYSLRGKWRKKHSQSEKFSFKGGLLQ